MRVVLPAAPLGGLLMAVLVLSAPAALASSSPVGITPDPAAPGTSTTFSVDCASLTAAGTATLIGTTLGLSEHIPMQASTHSNEFVTTVVLPACSTRAGTSRTSTAATACRPAGRSP